MSSKLIKDLERMRDDTIAQTMRGAPDFAAYSALVARHRVLQEVLQRLKEGSDTDDAEGEIVETK